MRMHADRATMVLLRKAETPAAVRRAVEVLLRNPYPEDAWKIEGYASRYELFVEGFWIVYEVESGGAEMIIRLVNIVAN